MSGSKDQPSRSAVIGGAFRALKVLMLAAVSAQSTDVREGSGWDSVEVRALACLEAGV